MQRKGTVRKGIPSSKSRHPISWTEANEFKALHKGKNSNKIQRGSNRTTNVRASTLEKYIIKNYGLY